MSIDVSPPSATPAPIDAVPLRHPWRWVAAIVILSIAGLFLYGVATNDAYRWGTFGKYILDERIVSGVWVTIKLTVLSMVLAVVVAVILAVMRLSPNPVLRWVAWVYLWIFRGTPVFVQLVFWGLFPTIYKNIQLGVPFGPSLLHIDLQNLSNYFILAVIGLGLNEAAYLAEIIRAGITSVPEGQSEASTALGMSWLIGQLKTTSLAVAVPFTLDLFGRQRDISAVIFQPVPLLLVAAAWYLLITSILMVGQFYLERYFSRGASRRLTNKQLEALNEAQQLGEAGHV